MYRDLHADRRVSQRESNPRAMRYDTVELNHPDGSQRRLSPAEFEQLPLLERVQWMSQGRFRFLKDGVKIPSHEALKREKKT